jgi:hypothetical protein
MPGRHEPKAIYLDRAGRTAILLDMPDILIPCPGAKSGGRWSGYVFDWKLRAGIAARREQDGSARRH